ncbi:MAG TPA: hypothetical protein VM529_03755 [Gemmata sp.]|nr:hypothetical protein [Gemmata sp.]
MASSVITAVQARWAAIFAQAGDPPLYFDFVPQTDGSGDQRRQPYAVLRDQTGLSPEYTSDDGAVETGTVVVEVYAVTMADVDAYVARAKWGGQDPDQRAGLDWFSLSLTTSPRYPVHLRRTNERRSFTAFDHLGRASHRCDLAYEVLVGVEGGGY